MENDIIGQIMKKKEIELYRSFTHETVGYKISEIS